MNQSFDYFKKEIALLLIFVEWFWSRPFYLPQWVICLHITFGILKGGIILALLVTALLSYTLFSAFFTTKDNY